MICFKNFTLFRCHGIVSCGAFNCTHSVVMATSQSFCRNFDW